MSNRKLSREISRRILEPLPVPSHPASQMALTPHHGVLPLRRRPIFPVHTPGFPFWVCLSFHPTSDRSLPWTPSRPWPLSSGLDGPTTDFRFAQPAKALRANCPQCAATVGESGSCHTSVFGADRISRQIVSITTRRNPASVPSNRRSPHVRPHRSLQDSKLPNQVKTTQPFALPRIMSHRIGKRITSRTGSHVGPKGVLQQAPMATRETRS